ncbi:hypothetical protein [Streptomyces tsukubensis]|uniref:hypothetical protein n=1 Tax=Streptomyces tsukubensis TaxID=83656 RepID=UPI00344CDB39
MTVEMLDVLELDDDYTPPPGPHIAWQQAQYFTTIGIDDAQEVRTGGRLYLRDGRRVLATAEAEGDRRTVIDIADDAAAEIAPWLASMRHLADAVALDRDAQTIDFHAAQMLYSWQAAQDVYTAGLDDIADDEISTAHHYEELLRAVVPRDDQEDVSLPQAAALHSERLRSRARALRVRALIDMPDRESADLPSVPWTGPYSKTQQQDIRDHSPNTWYADLPHQLLTGWGNLDTKAHWPSYEEQTGHRDALIRWAAGRGLPKQDMARATGLARTTIDRILG